MIAAIAVTRVGRLIDPRPTPVIVAIAVTWGSLQRAHLLSEGGRLKLFPDTLLLELRNCFLDFGLLFEQLAICGPDRRVLIHQPLLKCFYNPKTRCIIQVIRPFCLVFCELIQVGRVALHREGEHFNQTASGSL